MSSKRTPLTSSAVPLVGGRITQQSCGAGSIYAARKVPRPMYTTFATSGIKTLLKEQVWGVADDVDGIGACVVTAKVEREGE